MKKSYSLREKIGQHIVIGFHGDKPGDEEVEVVKSQISDGLIGGVVLFAYNAEDKDKLGSLILDLKSVHAKIPIFISLDQEGGRVTRLKSENGFMKLESHQFVSKNYSPKEAYEYYKKNLVELKTLGFNLNFSPCVDLAFEGSKIISNLERSFGDTKKTVIEYASALIDAQNDLKIMSCIKHFPGHGSARGDTHIGLIDITNDYQEVELEVFKELKNKAPAIMTSHLINKNVDSDLPATLSKKHLSLINDNYNGLIISDCLHMGAILNYFTLEEVVKNSLLAGINILLFSNNPLAAKAQGIRYESLHDVTVINEWKVPDKFLPNKIIDKVEELVKTGVIEESLIDNSFNKIIKAKEIYII